MIDIDTLFLQWIARLSLSGQVWRVDRAKLSTTLALFRADSICSPL
jgi:hypothetical protein